MLEFWKTGKKRRRGDTFFGRKVGVVNTYNRKP
jgi:hypothetical protein